MKIRRWIVWLVAALLAFEVLYAVSANLVLRSDWLAEKVNRRPEKLHVEWAGAWTVFPGIVSVSGVTARGQSGRQQWYAEADRMRVTVSLLSLASRTFRTYRVSGSGLTYRHRAVPKPEEEAQPESRPVPPIPGLEPNAPPPPKRAKKKNKPWTVDIHGIHLKDVRQVWIRDYRLEGPMTVSGRVKARPRGPLMVRGGGIDVSAGTLFHGDAALMSDMALSCRLDLGPYNPKEEKGVKLLKHLSGSLDVRARTTELALLNAYLSPPVWPVFQSPEGTFEGRFLLEKGVMRDGTRLTFEAGEVTAELLDWQAAGTATISCSVSGGDNADEGTLGMTIRDVVIGLPDDSTPLMTCPNLQFGGMGLQLDLASGLSAPAENLDAVKVVIEDATVPELGALNDLLPPASSFSIIAGAARAGLQVDLTPSHAEGRFTLAAAGIDAAFRDIPLKGDLAAEILAISDDLTSRRLDVAGSSVTLSNFVTVDEDYDAGEWEGVIHVSNGTLELTRPMQIDGNVALTMKDTRPIVAVFVRDRNLLRHFSGLMTIENVEGAVDVATEADGLYLENLEVTGDRLLLLGNLIMREKKADGILFTRFRGISVGLELTGGKSKLKIFRPREWYDGKALHWIASSPTQLNDRN